MGDTISALDGFYRVMQNRRENTWLVLHEDTVLDTFSTFEEADNRRKEFEAESDSMTITTVAEV